jgi:hypothetical protein
MPDPQLPAAHPAFAFFPLLSQAKSYAYHVRNTVQKRQPFDESLRVVVSGVERRQKLPAALDRNCHRAENWQVAQRKSGALQLQQITDNKQFGHYVRPWMTCGTAVAIKVIRRPLGCASCDRL